MLLLPLELSRASWSCPAQALECQKISNQLLGVLREINLAWPERIVAPVQFVRGLVEASPWIVNSIALSRDLGEPRRAGPGKTIMLRLLSSIIKSRHVGPGKWLCCLLCRADQPV